MSTSLTRRGLSFIKVEGSAAEGFHANLEFHIPQIDNNYAFFTRALRRGSPNALNRIAQDFAESMKPTARFR